MIIPSAPLALASYQNTMRDLRYMITDAVIPSRSLDLETFRYYGLNFESPVQTKQTIFSITFYVHDGMEQYRFFYDWVDYIHGSGSYDMLFREEYTTTVLLEKLSEVGPEPTVTMTTKFNKAYPFSIQDQAFTWGDDEVVKSTVNFTYHGYTLE